MWAIVTAWKKVQVPKAGIWVKFCGSSIIEELVSYNGLVLLLRDVDLKKLK